MRKFLLICLMALCSLVTQDLWAQTDVGTATWSVDTSVPNYAFASSPTGVFTSSEIEFGDQIGWGYTSGGAINTLTSSEVDENGDPDLTRRVTMLRVLDDTEDEASDHNHMYYKFTVAEGYTFTPTAVSLVCARGGTNGGHIDIGWKSGDNDVVTLAKEQQPLRYNQNPDDYGNYHSTYSYDLANDFKVADVQGGESCGLYLNFYGAYSCSTDAETEVTTCEGKEYGFGEVVVTGTLLSATGEAIEVTISPIEYNDFYKSLAVEMNQSGLTVAGDASEITVTGGSGITVKTIEQSNDDSYPWFVEFSGKLTAGDYTITIPAGFFENAVGDKSAATEIKYTMTAPTAVSASGDIVWAFTGGTASQSATLSTNASAAITAGNSSVADNLTTNTDNPISTDVIVYTADKSSAYYNQTATFTTFYPVAASTDGDAIDFPITVNEGYTFTPTGISLYGIKNGTDNDCYIEVKWVDADDNETVLVDKTKLERARVSYKNESNSSVFAIEQFNFFSASTTNISALEAEETGTLRVYLYGAKDKAVGLSTIIINGTVAEATTAPEPFDLSLDPANESDDLTELENVTVYYEGGDISIASGSSVDIYLYKDGSSAPVATLEAMKNMDEATVDGHQGYKFVILDTSGQNEISFTEAGEYTFTIEEGTFTDGNENYNNVLNGKYTIVDNTGGGTGTLELTIDPDPTDPVTSFGPITITCENGLKFNENDTFTLTKEGSEDTWNVYFSYTTISNGCILEIQSGTGSTAITDAGTYTLTIPAGTFTDNDGNTNSEDLKIVYTIEEGDASSLPEGYFLYEGIVYSVNEGGTTASVAQQVNSTLGYTNVVEGAVVIPETASDGTTTYDVTAIAASAFNGNSTITSVVIPESITSIGNSAFYGCSSLDTITCERTTPPEAIFNSFGGSGGQQTYSHCTLYVPCEDGEVIAAYKTATGWSYFATNNNLKGIDGCDGEEEDNTFSLTIDADDIELSTDHTSLTISIEPTGIELANESATIDIVHGTTTWPATVAEGEVEGTWVLTLIYGNAITETDDYVITFTDGFFTLEEDGVSKTSEPTTVTYSYTAPEGDTFALILEPDPEEEGLTELSIIKVTAEGGGNMRINTSVENYTEILDVYQEGVTDPVASVVWESSAAAQGEAFVIHEYGKTTEGSEITLSDAGAYTIEIPDSFFCIMSNGAVTATSLKTTAKYTIEESGEGDTGFALTFSPAEGDVELNDNGTFGTITISNENGTLDFASKTNTTIILTDGTNEVAHGIYEGESTENSITFNIYDATESIMWTPTEGESYILSIEEGFFVDGDGNGNASAEITYTIASAEEPTPDTPTYIVADGIVYTINEDGTTVSVAKQSDYTEATATGAIEIPETVEGYTVTEIAEQAFYTNATITSLVIPSTVETIGKQAFYSCANLDSIVCEATTPPSIESNTFGGSAFAQTYTHAKLYVPCESVSTYKSASNWSSFLSSEQDSDKSGAGIYAVDGCPDTFEPTVVVDESSSESIELEIEGAIATTGTAGDISVTLDGVEVATATASLENGVWTLSFSQTLEEGDYVLTIPYGYFTDEKGEINDPITVNFSITSEKEPFEVTIEESAVTNESVTVTITTDAEGLKLTEANKLLPIINKETEEEVGYVRGGQDSEGNWIFYFVTEGNIPTSFTTEGTYTVEVPEGYFTDEEGASSIATSFEFTIGTAETPTPEPGEIPFTIEPADEAEVETLDAIIITNGTTGLTSILEASQVIVYNANGDSIATASAINAGEGEGLSDSITIVFDPAISEAGEYKVVIPANTLFTSIDGEPYAADITLNYVVTGKTETENPLPDGLILYDGIVYEIISGTNVSVACQTNYLEYEGVSGAVGDVVIPETFEYDGVEYTVTALSDYAFWYDARETGLLQNLNTVTTSLDLPATIETIGRYAIYGMDEQFTGLTCRAITPPTLEHESAIQRTYDTAPLYVPCESVEAYEEAEYWSNYVSTYGKGIIGYDCDFAIEVKVTDEYSDGTSLTIAITPKDITLEETSNEIIITQGTDTIATATIEAVEGEEGAWMVSFSETLEVGEYTMIIPEGLFVNAEGGKNEALEVTITIASEPTEFELEFSNIVATDENVTVTISAGDEEITLSEDAGLLLISDTESGDSIGLARVAAGEDDAWIFYYVDENNHAINLEAGTYTVEIPEGYFTNEAGTIGNAETSFSFTIEDYTPVVGDYPFTFTPASGDTVETLSQIIITNGEAGLTSTLESGDVIVYGENGEEITTVTSIEGDGDEGLDTQITLTLAEAIDSIGEYTVVIPANTLYDGMSEPYAAEITLTYTVAGKIFTITPQEGEVDILEGFELTYDGAIKMVGSTIDTYLLDEEGNKVAGVEALAGDTVTDEDGNTIGFKFGLVDLDTYDDTVIYTPGTYTITIESGSFLLGEDETPSPSVTITYTVTGEKAELVINPENNTTVDSLSVITITCEAGMNLSQTFDTYLYDKEMNHVAAVDVLTSDKITDEAGNTIGYTLTLLDLTSYDETTIFDAGEYTLTIPYNTFTYGISSIPNDELVLTYTIGGETVDTYTFEFDPANGATVDSLTTITITNGEAGLTMMCNASDIKVYDKNDEVVTTVADIYGDGVESLDTYIILTLADTITESGTYTVVIPEDVLFNGMADEPYSKPIKLTYTIGTEEPKVVGPGSDLPEGAIFTTDFTDWTDLSYDESNGVVVDAITTTGEDFTFTLWGVSVDTGDVSQWNTDDDGNKTTPKFEGEGALIFAKYDSQYSTCEPYVETSTISYISKITFSEAVTGSNRGVKISVKGEGDEDWEVVYSTSINSGATDVTVDINRENCQIKIESIALNQNTYILDFTIYGEIEEPTPKSAYVFDEVEEGVYAIIKSGEELLELGFIGDASSCYATFAPGDILYDDDNIEVAVATDQTYVANSGYQLGDIQAEHPDYTAFVNFGSKLSSIDETTKIEDPSEIASGWQGALTVTPKSNGELTYSVNAGGNIRTFGIYDQETNEWVTIEHEVTGDVSVYGTVEKGKEYLLVGTGTNSNLYQIDFVPAEPISIDLYSEVEDNTYAITASYDELLAMGFIDEGNGNCYALLDAGTTVYEGDDVKIEVATDGTYILNHGGKISAMKADFPDYTTYVNCGSYLDNNFDETVRIEDVASIGAEWQGMLMVTPIVNGELSFGVYAGDNKRTIGIYELATEEEIASGTERAWVNINTFCHRGPDDDNSTDKTVAAEAPGYVSGSVTAGRQYLLVGGGRTNLTMHQITFIPEDEIVTEPEPEVETVSGVITWAFNEGTEGQKATITSSTEEAFADNAVAIGSNLSYAGTRNVTDANEANETYDQTVTFTLFDHAETQAEAAETNAIDFTVTMAEGFGFAPTEVSLYATRVGTDACNMNVTWIDSEGNEIPMIATSSDTGDNPGRANGTPNTFTKYTLDLADYGIEVIETGTFTLRVNVFGMANGKTFGLANIVINGGEEGETEDNLYATLCEEIATLETNLDATWSTIETDYPAAATDASIVAEKEKIEGEISDLQAAVDASYADGTLADEAAGYEAEIAAIQAEIEQLLANAIATGINSITIDNNFEGKSIYTISGQKVSAPSKAGIYIIDGKKVVIK